MDEGFEDMSRMNAVVLWAGLFCDTAGKSLAGFGGGLPRYHGLRGRRKEGRRVARDSERRVAKKA